MSYEILYPWRKHPRILQLVLYSDLTPESLREGLDETHELLAQAQMPMNVLLSFIGVRRLDQTMLNLFLQHPALRDPQLGHLLFVNLSPQLHRLAHEIDQKLNIHIKYVTNEDAAWEFFNLLGIC